MRHGRKTSRLSCFARSVQSKRGWRTVGFSHPSAFRGLHQPVIMDASTYHAIRAATMMMVMRRSIMACSRPRYVRLATVAPSSARILIGNRYAPLPQRGEGEAVLHAPASRPWENSGAGFRPLARRKHHKGHKAAAARAIDYITPPPKWFPRRPALSRRSRNTELIEWFVACHKPHKTMAPAGERALRHAPPD